MSRLNLTVAQRLERIPLSRFHYVLLLVVGIPYSFVAMDLLLISLVLTPLKTLWGLPGALTGFLLGSAFIGMLVGAASWGYLADRLGRKRALELTIVIYTVSTGLTALAPDWVTLIALRIITGIGLGGCIPLCFVYLSEFIPARHRGRFLVLLDSFWAYGWIFAALLGYLVIPPFGWGAYFLTGAVPILTLPLVHTVLPRSLRYLENKGKIEEAQRILRQIEEKAGIKAASAQTKSRTHSKSSKVPISELWSPTYRRRTLFSWIMWFAMVYGYYSLFLWILQFMKVPYGTALWFVLLTSFAQIPGYFSAAWLVDAVGRKPTQTVYLLLATISVIGFAFAATAIEQVIWLSLATFFILGGWGVVMTYCAEIYPTRVRGTGYGAASGFGRSAGVIGPTILGFILDNYTVTIALMITAAFFLIVAVDTAILGIETKGKTLEEISK